MSNIVKITNQEFSASQLALMQKTVAKDTNAAEFDQFLMICKGFGLNPFRKEIYALVFNKNKPDKRSVAFITSIDGYRVIAERTGRYRPDEDPPRFEYSSEVKSEINPLGIVSATVSVWKLGQDSNWYKSTATAYWDEFANISTWDGVSKLDGKWIKMPRQMLAKCAESHALRKAFPDAFNGLYSEDEMDKAHTLDLTASEIIHQDIVARHNLAIGQTLTFQFDKGGDLEIVPLGQVFDRTAKELQTYVDYRQVEDFQRRNEAALKAYWGACPSDALELKKLREKRIEDLKAA